MRTSRLTAVLERTLDAKAAQAADDPADVIPLDGRSRSVGGRRVLATVAASLTVVALVAGVLALDGDDRGTGGDGGDDVAVRPLTIGDPPDGWLVPGWVPEGMTLWGVDTSSNERSDVGPSGTIPQLFGDPEGGRAIYVTSSFHDGHPTIIEGVAVRGTTSSAPGDLVMPEEDMGDAIRWDERGVSITALYRGVSQDEAIAMLDALAWRSDDPRDGFAPPADTAWPLRAEAVSRDTTDHSASLLYRRAATAAGPFDGSDALRVHTTSSSSVSASYLETWYLEGEGDGTAPIVTSPDGAPSVDVDWPDGRSVTVEGPTDGESALGADVLERIAESVTPSDDDGIAALRTSLESRLAALTPVATADTSIGAIDVRDDGGFLRLCLHPADGTAPNCDTEATTIAGSLPEGLEMASAEWTVDGTWYVAVASRGEVQRIVGSRGMQPVGPESDDLPAETIVAGEWTVRLVAPAPDIDGVCTANEIPMACLHSRPE